MSKYDLRDVSKRLSESQDTESVVFEFLGYLQALKPDWRATLAFYEVGRDALTRLYARDGDQLQRRDLHVPVEQLPPRLVRKFFHPSAFSDAASRRSLLASLFKTSPYYEPEPSEAGALRPLVTLPDWECCVCLPLADQEDLLAMVILTSRKKNAFGSRALNDLLPVKGMASLALAQHLYRASRAPEPEYSEPVAAVPDTGAPGGESDAAFREPPRPPDIRPAASTGPQEASQARLEALTQELARADQSSSHYRHELERVKGHLDALEEQSTAATAHLNEAYEQLTETQDRMYGLQRTVRFLQDVFQVMSQEHDVQELAHTMVLWFSENFGVERCSLMVLDGGTLRIAAQRGIDPAVADRVQMQIGQGISGWVAHHRKPLLVRVRSDAQEVSLTAQDVYNSDSFIAVPLVQGDRVVGVLNLSNKAAGLPFDQLDLDRAMLTGSLLAMTLGADDALQRSAAWA